MKNHSNIQFNSSLEMKITDNFRNKVLDKLIEINPNIREVTLMDFGLEDDISGNFYNVELVIDINDNEMLLESKRTDINTFNWFNNVSMNQAYNKYVMDTTLELIEKYKEDIEEII